MIKVAILFGGPGKEHEVSISSAKNILENIDRNIFDVIEIFVNRDKKYLIDSVIFEEQDGLQEIKKRGVEVVFPIIHGTYGEDGELQSKLEELGVSFVGSTSKVSYLTINKNKTNELLKENNIIIPQSKIINKNDFVVPFNYPIIVKPIDEGSSVDLYKFKNNEDYNSSLDVIFKNYTSMLVQEFIQGREFTCGVIEINKVATSLIATEIILTKGDLFDYDAKYSVGGCREITPAEIDEDTMNKIKETALRCHTVLGCNSISRTDMILNDGKLYVLEINTVPGMTKTSFIPQQAKACGYDMKELITLLIKNINS
jgi:D-alanine-D-alanine ligase